TPGSLDAPCRDALHRPTAASGRTNFLQALAGGTTPTQVAAVLFGSPESEAGRVNDLYRRVLHRDADPSGLGTALDALRRGAREEDLLVNLVSSEEYFGFYQPFVGQAYQALLRRPVDAGGLSAWTEPLPDGATH